MHYFEEQCQISLFVVIYFKTMCNKTMIRFVFVISGTIKVSVSVMSLVLSSTLIIPDITKTNLIIVLLQIVLKKITTSRLI